MLVTAALACNKAENWLTVDAPLNSPLVTMCPLFTTSDAVVAAPATSKKYPFAAVIAELESTLTAAFAIAPDTVRVAPDEKSVDELRIEILDDPINDANRKLDCVFAVA